MKMKRLCALAVLLTSSLAGTANNSASKSEDQYYAGLNFGAGWYPFRGMARKKKLT